MCKIVIFIVAALALACAQNVPTPQTCSAIAESMDWNSTALINGSWLQLTRNPAGSQPPNACMEFIVSLEHDNVTLSIDAKHSSSSISLYQNEDETASVKLVSGAKTGYNVTFTENGVQKNPVFIKLLQLIDYTYIVGCGYTNASNSSTSYGFILGRNNYTIQGIKQANDGAFPFYSNFQNNTNYANITQVGCTRNSAAQSLPLISGVLALALLLIKAH